MHDDDVAANRYIVRRVALRRRWIAPRVALIAATLAVGFLTGPLVGQARHELGAPVPGLAVTAAGQAAHAGQADGANVTMAGDTLTIVAPAGAFDRIAMGGHDLDLPPVLRLSVGQTIAIRNDDRLTHIVLGEAVAPGQTVRRTLTRPGIEVYAAGCAAHGVGTGMTSLIVSGAESEYQ